MTQKYYQFHAHIREHDTGTTESRYEETGHGGLVVGDAPCRTDHDQDHFYWPWDDDPSTFDEHHNGGMVGIPGGEYDGGGLQHHIGINTQMDPDTDLSGCGTFSETEMQEAIINNPELSGVPAVCYVTHPSQSASTLVNWKNENELLLGQDGWHDVSGHHWSQYHDVLDSGLREWWHFASDDYSYNRDGFDDSRDINRNYLILNDHTPENVVQALIDGAFYSTHSPDDDDSGTDRNLPPTIDEITVDEQEHEIEIVSTEANSCEWIGSGGSSFHSGFTLPYRDYESQLDGSWAYARLINPDGEARTQPWAFDRDD